MMQLDWGIRKTGKLKLTKKGKKNARYDDMMKIGGDDAGMSSSACILPLPGTSIIL